MDRADYPTAVLSDDEAVDFPAVSSAEFHERYEILRTLGRGGMAVVYLARDRRLDQAVALKIFHTPGSEKTSRRILREARTGRLLDHPNLVRVHDLLETPEGPAIVMEHIEGKTLREVLEERTSLPAEEAIPIFDQILQGLEALHGAGIIHRDVKPENVFLLPDGRVKVGDYSICLPMTATRLTADSGSMGTPQYMAPEQIRGDDPVFATDLYAAGIVLYEMLAGRRPFDGDNPSQVIHKQLSEAPPMKPLARRVPSWLRALLALLLAKSPRERFRSAAEVRRALTRRSVGVHWRRAARRTVAAALMLGVGAVVWLAVGSVLHRRVHAYQVKGAEVEACDGRGRRLWSHAWPVAVTHAAEADLDGNGVPDWLGFAAGEGGVGSLTRTFFLLDSGDWGEWQGSFQYLEHQRESGGLKSHFWVEDLNGDGRREVTEVIQGYWAPSALRVHSMSHENHIVEILHPGHIQWIRFADVNADGWRDIIGLAVNNPLGHTAALFALDSRAAWENQNPVGGPPIFCPGWRTAKGWEYAPRALMGYALLPLEKGSARLADPQVLRLEPDGWSIQMEDSGVRGDWMGNIEGGPTAGMGAEGRAVMLDYYRRIQGMRAAALNGDAALLPWRDWELPQRFRGSGLWEEIFLLNKGRALLECARPAEGLAVLRELTLKAPGFQEGWEAYGTALFLSGGPPQEAERLVITGAMESVQSPVTAFYARLKIRILGGAATLADFQRLPVPASNFERVEMARLWMAWGRWDAAAEVIGAMASGAFYTEALPPCRAVLNAHAGTLEEGDLEAAEREAQRCIELRDMAGLARAIAAARSRNAAETDWLDRFLADLRRRSAWDLDARLTLRIFEGTRVPAGEAALHSGV